MALDRLPIQAPVLDRLGDVLLPDALRSLQVGNSSGCFLNGVYVGLALPNSWQEQMQRGQAWHVVPGPAGRPNPNNGHCVYVCGYTSAGPVCVTWGKKQQMSWEYLATYCDEAYAIVDGRDLFLKNSPVDEAKLESLLNRL